MKKERHCKIVLVSWMEQYAPSADPENPPQRIAYNGHKKVRAFKFQSVVVPHEVIANLPEPILLSWTSLYFGQNYLLETRINR